MGIRVSRKIKVDFREFKERKRREREEDEKELLESGHSEYLTTYSSKAVTIQSGYVQ